MDSLTSSLNKMDLKDDNQKSKMSKLASDYIKLLETRGRDLLPKKSAKKLVKKSVNKGGNTIKNRVILPKLRKIDESNKKHKYKLNYSTLKRKMAINEGIRKEVSKKNKTQRQAAIAKKGRFNILRIYRRNNNKEQCKLITKDMKYIDKKYGLNKTKDIC